MRREKRSESQAPRDPIVLKQEEDRNFVTQQMENVRCWVDSTQPCDVGNGSSDSQPATLVLDPSNSYLRAALYQQLEQEYGKSEFYVERLVHLLVWKLVINWLPCMYFFCATVLLRFHILHACHTAARNENTWMSRVLNWVFEWAGHCREPQIKFEVNESNNRGDSSTAIRGDSKEATPVGACSGICKRNASSNYVQQTCCWTQYVTRPGLSLPPVCRPPSTFLGWISKAGNWPILSTVRLNKVRSGWTFRIWLLWCCEWQLYPQTSKANISCRLPLIYSGWWTGADSVSCRNLWYQVPCRAVSSISTFNITGGHLHSSGIGNHNCNWAHGWYCGVWCKQNLQFPSNCPWWHWEGGCSTCN